MGGANRFIKKKVLNRISPNFSISKGDNIKADTVGKLVVIAMFLFILGPAITIWAMDIQLSDLEESIKSLSNNKGFSEISKKIGDSTLMLKIKEDDCDVCGSSVGNFFVDSEGQGWSGGTAFSIGDDLFLSASHIVENQDISDINVVWKEQEYSNRVLGFIDFPEYDLAILLINLSVPSVEFIDEERAEIGSKIGFIGYPLNTDFHGNIIDEPKQILHDGIVSSIREESKGFFWYTINSFINKGNSGGPVYLSDTGKVIGVVSARQNEPIIIPNVDKSKLTEGEKVLYDTNVFMIVQLAKNTQAGIGKIVGINRRVLDNIKNSVKK